MPINTHTKILATIGPSTASEEMIEKLVLSGVDAFRFNFSHGTHAEHAERLKIVRALSEKYGRHLTVVADLQGPKLRIGTFKTDKVLLQKGQKFVLDMLDENGDETRVQLPHKEIFAAIKAGDKLLLNDGNIELEVLSNENQVAQTVVKVGGYLSAHKGVNLPNVKLPISAITQKDKKDLEFALNLGVDWVCLSFVQSVEDVRMARNLIGDKAWIISKLEKPSAIDELDDIVKESDGIMVARGDLGVECPIQTVPVLQKRIVKTCRKYGRPVIVATQMLESMIVNPTPTRAEVSDVANAVFDGADAVMLSAETAAGSYPAEAVAMMHQIITQVEEDASYYSRVQQDKDLSDCDDMADAITYAASEMTNILPNMAGVVT
ncbi:MAG: pyruvate kinase, partial [Alphaproteobacteria bacterium]|nr:pyruvate kinase [Alphaproteobacteria bacterium]